MFIKYDDRKNILRNWINSHFIILEFAYNSCKNLDINEDFGWLNSFT